MTSSQQELPPWESEQPTPAGPSHGAAASNSSQPKAQVQSNGDVELKMAAAASSVRREGCCSRLIKKCGPIGWYFSPMFDRLGYSLLTAFYNLIMFPYTLAVMIIVITLWSVSVGLLILVFGFILYWWTCEIAVVFARIDLALAYYMVEDNEDLILNRSHRLQLSLYKQIAPCPCSASSRGQGAKCCDGLLTRMKSLAFRCDMYKILLFQAIFKPLIVYATWWIFIIVAYNIACIFAPIVYISYSDVFTKHYWCPFGDVDCDDGVCDCRVIAIENFGGALLFGFVAFLILPLVLHVNIWFAKLSKVMSYYWVSNYYNGGMDSNDERGNLLAASTNREIRDTSVSTDAHNTNDTHPHAQTAIVHSLNNPYGDTDTV